VHLYSEPRNHHSYGSKKAQLLTVKGLTGGTPLMTTAMQPTQR